MILNYLLNVFFYKFNPNGYTLLMQAIPGWKNAKEERRAQKLHILRRTGRGPPKKGAGKKTKKKGGK